MTINLKLTVLQRMREVAVQMAKVPNREQKEVLIAGLIQILDEVSVIAGAYAAASEFGNIMSIETSNSLMVIAANDTATALKEWVRQRAEDLTSAASKRTDLGHVHRDELRRS